MAINKNHEFGELDGVKCAIVEKNASKERVTFLQDLLEQNGFEVLIVPSPPPKAVPAHPAATIEGATQPQSQPQPQPKPQPLSIETFTIGVTNVSFNPINAIFGRQLKTKEGQVVTLAYWNQKEKLSHDEVPYYETTE
ncbi:MAG TPA: hypothetical protein VI548_02720 [Chitinophagaceae bacterium]|nr:hypothetical protein [Chitinophagaceae bacterium]